MKACGIKADKTQTTCLQNTKLDGASRDQERQIRLYLQENACGEKRRVAFEFCLASGLQTVLEPSFAHVATKAQKEGHGQGSFDVRQQQGA